MLLVSSPFIPLISFHSGGRPEELPMAQHIQLSGDITSPAGYILWGSEVQLAPHVADVSHIKASKSLPHMPWRRRASFPMPLKRNPSSQQRSFGGGRCWSGGWREILFLVRRRPADCNRTRISVLRPTIPQPSPSAPVQVTHSICAERLMQQLSVQSLPDAWVGHLANCALRHGDCLIG